LLAQTAAESARDLAQGYAAAADVAKIEWQGAWSAGSYNEHDAVEHNGTSYIATTTTSEEPSISATDWDVLALKGTDGTGSGDVSSSISSSTDGSLVVFDGAGGKTVKQQATGAAGTVLKSNGTAPIYDLPVPTAAAGGTVDAITATYTTGVVALSDGMLVRVTAAGANTGAVTFAPNSLTAHAITKLGGTALSAGDIKGAGHELLLAYNLANTRWELLNPAVTASASFVKQQVRYQTGEYMSGTGTIPSDDTIPQKSEGNEFMTLAITPTSATSKLVISVNLMVRSSVANHICVALFDGYLTTDAVACTA